MDDSNNIFGKTPNTYSPEINVPPVSNPQPFVNTSQPVVEQPQVTPQPVVEQPVMPTQVPVEQPVIPSQEPLVPQQPIVEQPILQNQIPPIEKTKKKLPIIAIVGGILLLLLIGFFVGKKFLLNDDGSLKTNKDNQVEEGQGLIIVDNGSKTPKVEETKPSDVCASEQKDIVSLINQFEDYQKERDANSVLALFTEPEVKEEREELANLDGSDSNLPPRLYNNVSTNYNTDSYKVIGDPSKVENTLNCFVLVEELRAYYGGLDSPEYESARPENYSIEVQKMEGKWMIKSYQSTKENIKKTKYAGFLMEISQ